MSAENIIGTKPWLPGALGRSRWWNEPVPAERLAVLRIAVGLVLLFDLWFTLRGAGFYAAPGLTHPREVEAWYSINAFFPDGNRWPVSQHVDTLLLIVGFLAPLTLTFGAFSRLSAFACWALTIRLHNLNWGIQNGGDMVKIITLFYLMLSPCGAVWSVDAGRRKERIGSVMVAPWPLRLLLIQMAMIYFCNGFMKLLGEDWRNGTAMHWVLSDLHWARVSPNQLALPEWLLKLGTWTVLMWELLFPFLIWRAPMRQLALALGVIFHIGNMALLELGLFPVYMLCLYLPFVPWERLRARPLGTNSSPADAPRANASPSQM